MNFTTINLQQQLEAALDAAAPDGPSWLAGQEAFWTKLPKGSVGQALEAALDAAAPDGPSWLAGRQAFFGGNAEEGTLLWKRIPRFRDEQFSPRQLRDRD